MLSSQCLSREHAKNPTFYLFIPKKFYMKELNQFSGAYAHFMSLPKSTRTESLKIPIYAGTCAQKFEFLMIFVLPKCDI
jgi:hypothetical protein